MDSWSIIKRGRSMVRIMSKIQKFWWSRQINGSIWWCQGRWEELGWRIVVFLFVDSMVRHKSNPGLGKSSKVFRRQDFFGPHDNCWSWLLVVNQSHLSPMLDDHNHPPLLLSLCSNFIISCFIPKLISSSSIVNTLTWRLLCSQPSTWSSPVVL